MDEKSLASYRPVVFWSWNDQITRKGIEKQLKELKQAGIGGGFLHSRVGLVTEYLSDEWMEMVRYTAELAVSEKMDVWLYDEDRFPSGYAGGAVLEEDDSLRAKALCLIERERLAEFTVLQEYKTCSFDEKEYVIALCAAKDGNPNFEGKCYVDLLDRRTTECFIKHTHERYRQWVGKDFGKQIKGIFSDEFCYTQKAAFACPSVPFTTGMEVDFSAQKGYDLIACVEQLFFDYGDYHRVRRDFYEFLTKRFIASYTEPVHEWCKKNHLLFTGHLLNEDFLTSQTEWIGAAMPHYPHMGIPGVDKLGSDPSYLTTIKQLVSITEPFGQRALCEAFACSGHQFGPEGLKRVADWLCVLGINFINPHLTQYSMRGERKRDCPPDLSARQPWFSSAGAACFDHMARVCALTDGITLREKVLVLHPIQSVWAEYSPLHKPNPVFSIWSPKNPNAGQNFITETEKFEKPFTDLSDKLLKQGVDYHYGDEMVMAEHASVSGEGLFIGNCCYRTVVIPPVCVLQETTLQFLRELAERFGKEAVVFIRSFPDGMEQEDKERYTLVASVDEAVRFLRGRMRSEITLRDRNTNRPADQVYWRYTQTQDGKKTWFFVNAAENREYQTEMVLPFSFTPVVYDTVEDRRYRAPGTLTENGFILKADFTVGGSLMILEEPAATEECLPFLQSGVAFPYHKWEVLRLESFPAGSLQSGNLLPLDVVDYRAEGKEYRQTPIEFLWHSRFYRLKDGTPFEAAYAFTVDRLPEKPLLAFVEMGRHLDAVTLNGKPLSSVAAESRPEYLKDSFDAFLLDTLQVGRNEIVIQGKKCSNINGVGSHTRVPAGTEHIPTELEPVLLYGDFNAVETEEGHYVVDTGDRSVKGSTVFCGKPFYSGRIVYPVPVAQGGRLIRVEADAQSVTLLHNGKTVGTSYLKPFVFSLPLDLAERDRLEIVIDGSLENTFGPLHLADRKALSLIGPIYFSDPARYVKKPVLFDFGLKSVQILKDFEGE